MIGVDDKEFIIRNAIAPIKDNYDYIIIDCPPSLSMLTINAMTTADSVLVPIQCEYYALEGLSQLIHTIDLVKDRLNNDLEIEGVVFTMYDARTNLSLQVVENVKENLQQNIYKTIIPCSGNVVQEKKILCLNIDTELRNRIIGLAAEYRTGEISVVDNINRLIIRLSLIHI